MIDDMVNYEMFVKEHQTEDAMLMFNTSTHQRLFNILLGDFLSQAQRKRKNALPFGLPEPPSRAKPSDLTYLFYLRGICADARLGKNVELIRVPVEAFAAWLEAKPLIEDVWFPSVGAKSNMHLMRITYIKICGDIAKHNFTKLETNVRKICGALSVSGIAVDEAQGYLMLPEFYEWFHDHLLNYHSTTIAEYLNNIRWGIFDYVRPEFERAFERLDPYPKYHFRVPKDIAQPMARAMYWELMNMARSRPYFPRFTTTPYLMMRY